MDQSQLNFCQSPTYKKQYYKKFKIVRQSQPLFQPNLYQDYQTNTQTLSNTNNSKNYASLLTEMHMDYQQHRPFEKNIINSPKNNFSYYQRSSKQNNRINNNNKQVILEQNISNKQYFKFDIKKQNKTNPLLESQKKIEKSIKSIQDLLAKFQIDKNKKDNSLKNIQIRTPRYSQPLNQYKKIQYQKSPKIMEQKNIFKQLEQIKKLQQTISTQYSTNLKNIKLNDFIIIKQIGRGKFGIVSLVKHKKTNTLYALKKIAKQKIIQCALQQLIRQVKIQVYINHSHVVKLFTIFDDHSHIYLLNQFCPDGQLFQILKKKKKLLQKDAIGVIKDICTGISQLHRFSVIHRDLKPQNIVMSFGMAKICDFGWSVFSKNRMRQTFCGTPLYVSPELLIGNYYNEKVDLWALGIISFEILTGRLPFQINSEKELVKIINTNIQYPKYLSQQAIDFISLLLQKNPIQRVSIFTVLDHNFLCPNQVAKTLIGSKSDNNFRKK